MVFDFRRAYENVSTILFIDKGETYDKINKNVSKRGGRKHPIFEFYDEKGEYICEVRYGGTAANALQRGFWTHTKNALPYFNSLTNGWINYGHNKTLVKLFSLALNASEEGHEKANKMLQTDINQMKIKP